MLPGWSQLHRALASEVAEAQLLTQRFSVQGYSGFAEVCGRGLGLRVSGFEPSGRYKSTRTCYVFGNPPSPIPVFCLVLREKF